MNTRNISPGWQLLFFLTAISTLAFARLRQENRPKRYAFATVAGVLLNILVVVLFLAIIPKYVAKEST